MRLDRTTTKNGEGLAVPATRDNPGSTDTVSAIVSEEAFLRAAEPQIDDGLFRLRFANWRLSLLGTTCISWAVAVMYLFVDSRSLTQYWAAIGTLVFALIAAMCMVYEQSPAAGGSPRQRTWLLGWTLSTGVSGLVTGALPWFLPSGRTDLQLGAAAIVAIFTFVFAAARAHRPLIYASVGCQTAVLSLAMVFHAGVPVAVPIVLLFSAFAILFGIRMNQSARTAIGQQLYARYLHAELQKSHARQLRVQQHNVEQNERRRMMSDLHDGFGSQLLTSLHLLERGGLDAAGAAATVRECIDDLRLMVDAHEPAARDLGVLLGMLRYRLQRRVEAGGIRLRWRIDDLPESSPLPSQQGLDVLRILQEAISNAVQHAGAREIAVIARRLPRQLELAVEDDGCGFDAAQSLGQGRGMVGMQRRAARLGAELLFEARDDGSGTALRLRLRLPLGVAVPGNGGPA